MIADLNNSDIKELSEIYDPENRDSFISLYLDIDSLDSKFEKKKKNTCKSVLKGNKLDFQRCSEKHYQATQSMYALSKH